MQVQDFIYRRDSTIPNRGDLMKLFFLSGSSNILLKKDNVHQYEDKLMCFHYDLKWKTLNLAVSPFLSNFKNTCIKSSKRRTFIYSFIQFATVKNIKRDLKITLRGVPRFYSCWYQCFTYTGEPCDPHLSCFESELHNNAVNQEILFCTDKI